MTQATGPRAVAIGGDAHAPVISGDVRVEGPDAEAIQRAVRLGQEEAGDESRKRAMAEYLKAVRDASNRLPYAPLWDSDSPKLSSIYVAQPPEDGDGLNEPPHTGAAQALQATRRVRSIDEALERHRHVLLEGSSGLGKSTLLHYIAFSRASRPGDTLVPVPVSARGLAERTRSLSESLHEQVTVELGKHLQAPLPADIFAHRPFPGAVWLVLLDGLDEVASQQAQISLIQEINAHTLRPEGFYRFVIATRTGTIPTQLQEGVFYRYIMKKFHADQVREFSTNWFSVRPNRRTGDVERFLDRIEKSLGVDLTGIPLLLSIAAVVYEEDRQLPLPSGRTSLYTRFSSMLLEHKLTERREAFRGEWERRYGLEAAGQADRVFSNRRRVLEHVAIHLHRDPQGSLVDTAVSWLRDQNLISLVEDKEWLRERITALLIGTGLVEYHDGRVKFVHDTFREYFAALALAHSHKPKDKTARSLVARWQDEHWREVVRYLLGLWSEEGERIGHLLERIVKPRLWRVSETGLMFVAAVLSDGASVAPEFDNRVVDALLGRAYKLSSQTGWRFEPRNPLSALGGLAGRNRVKVGLAALAEDRTATHEVRVGAAEAAVRAGAADAVGKLADLAREAVAGETEDYSDLFEAISAIERLGLSGRLVALAADVAANTRLRLEAANAAERLGVSQGLVILARDASIPYGFQLEAVIRLRQTGRTGELLALAQDAAGRNAAGSGRAEDGESAGPSDAAEDAATALLSLAFSHLIMRPESKGKLPEFRGDLDDALEDLYRIPGFRKDDLQATAAATEEANRAREAVVRVEALAALQQIRVSMVAQAPAGAGDDVSRGATGSIGQQGASRAELLLSLASQDTLSVSVQPRGPGRPNRAFALMPDGASYVELTINEAAQLTLPYSWPPPAALDFLGFVGVLARRGRARTLLEVVRVGLPNGHIVSAAAKEAARLGYVSGVAALACDRRVSIGARVSAIEALGHLAGPKEASEIIKHVVRQASGPVGWHEVAWALQRLRDDVQQPST